MNRRVGRRWSKGEAIPHRGLSVPPAHRPSKMQGWTLWWPGAGQVAWSERRQLCTCACIRARRCDTGKSIPAVTREVPTASPSGTEKTFSFTPHLAFFIICSFASTSASSVLTFSDDVNTWRPTYTSSAPDTLDLRNWSYTSHWMLSWCADYQPLWPNRRKHLVTKHL